MQKFNFITEITYINDILNFRHPSMPNRKIKWYKLKFDADVFGAGFKKERDEKLKFD